jgi:membrane protein
MLIVPLFGKSIINLVGLFTKFIDNHRSIIDTVYTILQIPVSLIVIFITVKLVYVIAPDEKIKGKYVNKGALFTTISWLILTIIFSYYINNIAEFNLVYGNLANIVILLLWFYILAFIFVIGLYLNRIKTEAGIEKTNKIKLDEIRKKMLEDKNKEN